MTKKILAAIVAVMMVLALSVTAFAASIDLVDGCVANNDGEFVVADGSVTSSGTSFSVKLAEAVPDGDTVTVHIKGSSDGDFRVWLAAGTATFSNEPLWKASEQGVTTPGEFDVTFDLTAFPKDGTGTAADCIMFKAPSYDSKLSNFKLTFLSINGDEAPAAEAEAEEAPAEAEAEAEPEEAPAEAAEETTAEAPAEAETTAEAPAETETKAPATGLALAVVPAVMALAAVAVSKKH